MVLHIEKEAMSLSSVLYLCFSLSLFHFQPIFVLFVTISAVLFHCFKARGGGGTPDFKWQGWSKDLYRFEIFDFGIFLGNKILASIFWGSLIEVGIFWCIQITRPCSSMNKVKQILFCDCFCFLEMFLAWKFGMGFLGGSILVQGFLGGLFEALGIFLGFDFCSHSIIHVTWNLENPLTPPSPPPGFQGHVTCQNFTLTVPYNSHIRLRAPIWTRSVIF